MIARTRVVAALLALLLPAAALLAQAPRSGLRPTPSVGIGLAAAQGGGSGLSVLGALELGRARQALRPRLDFQFSRFGDRPAGNRLTSITAGLVAQFRSTGTRPYFTTGAGAYAGPGTGLRPGWSAGVGVVLAIRGYEYQLESRYHEWRTAGPSETSADRRFVMPISFQVRF